VEGFDTLSLLPSSSPPSSPTAKPPGNSESCFGETTMNSMEVLNASHEMGPGEYMGARELMEGAPNSYTMIAKGKVKCFVLTLEDYTTLLSSARTEKLLAEKKLEKKAKQTKNVKKKRRSKEEKELHETNLANSWYGLTDLGMIGRGTFGLVHMVEDSNDELKTTFALKIVSHEIIKKKNHLNRLMSEIDLLGALKSPFICKLYGSREDSFGYYLLMELVQGGELKRLIHPNGMWVDVSVIIIIVLNLFSFLFLFYI